MVAHKINRALTDFNKANYMYKMVTFFGEVPTQLTSSAPVQVVGYRKLDGHFLVTVVDFKGTKREMTILDPTKTGIQAEADQEWAEEDFKDLYHCYRYQLHEEMVVHAAERNAKFAARNS